MKNAGLLGCLLCSCLVLAPGCGADGFVCHTACELDTGPLELGRAAEIQYEAYAVGDGFFTGLEYLDNSEPEQVWRAVEQGRIVVPWSHAAVYRPGMQAWIRASGRMQNGTLSVWFFQRGDPEAFRADDSCTWECSMFW